MSMRRALIIFIILIVIGGLAWFIFLRPKAKDAVPGTGIFQSFFPLGSSGNDVGNLEGESNNGEIGSEVNVDTLRFTPLTIRSVAGFTTFTRPIVIETPSADPKIAPVKKTITEYVTRYISRSNGYVYEIAERDETQGQAIQVSNIFIPNIYEGYFADNSKTAILRFLKDDNQTIYTYAFPIPEPNPDNTRTQQEGVYLPLNTLGMAVSPNSSLVAELTTTQGSGIITTNTSSGAAKKQVLSTPFKEWVILWPTQNNLYVQTKASSGAEGFLYAIQADKTLKRVLGNILGLTTNISPSGTYVLYSESAGSSFTAKLFNTKTGSTQSLNLSVMPEKCTWLKNEDLICAGNESVPSASYPDSWYAGTVAFSDKLYRISTRTSTFETMYDSSAGGFDMTQLRVDEERNFLYFINKQTGVLWKFKL